MGQKIAIKANINGSAVYDDDISGKTKMSYTNPVLLKSNTMRPPEGANLHQWLTRNGHLQPSR